VSVYARTIEEDAMLHHLVHLLVYAVAVLLAARLVPGIHVRSFGGAFFFALVLAVLDKLLFKLLVIVSFPAVLLSFGLWLFVINAFLFWLADKVVDGVKLDGFGTALAGSLVTSLINWAITWTLAVR
jgi:putative membrane protein